MTLSTMSIRSPNTRRMFVFGRTFAWYCSRSVFSISWGICGIPALKSLHGRFTSHFVAPGFPQSGHQDGNLGSLFGDLVESTSDNTARRGSCSANNLEKLIQVFQYSFVADGVRSISG